MSVQQGRIVGLKKELEGQKERICNRLRLPNAAFEADEMGAYSETCIGAEKAMGFLCPLDRWYSVMMR